MGYLTRGANKSAVSSVRNQQDKREKWYRGLERSLVLAWPEILWEERDKGTLSMYSVDRIRPPLILNLFETLSGEFSVNNARSVQLRKHGCLKPKSMSKYLAKHHLISPISSLAQNISLLAVETKASILLCRWMQGKEWYEKAVDDYHNNITLSNSPWFIPVWII
jgi:hypothetical protein